MGIPETLWWVGVRPPHPRISRIPGVQIVRSKCSAADGAAGIFPCAVLWRVSRWTHPHPPTQPHPCPTNSPFQRPTAPACTPPPPTTAPGVPCRCTAGAGVGPAPCGAGRSLVPPLHSLQPLRDGGGRRMSCDARPGPPGKAVGRRWWLTPGWDVCKYVCGG